LKLGAAIGSPILSHLRLASLDYHPAELRILNAVIAEYSAVPILAPVVFPELIVVGCVKQAQDFHREVA